MSNKIIFQKRDRNVWRSHRKNYDIFRAQFCHDDVLNENFSRVFRFVKKEKLILISKVFVLFDDLNDCIDCMQLIRIKFVSIRDNENWRINQCLFLANQSILDSNVLIEINKKFEHIIMREIWSLVVSNSIQQIWQQKQCQLLFLIVQCIQINLNEILQNKFLQ